MSEKHVFTFEDEEFYIEKPNNEILQQAATFHSQHIRKGLEEGMMTRSEMKDIFDNKKSTATDAELQTTKKEILDAEYKLHIGGISKQQGRKIAIDCHKKRSKLMIQDVDALEMDGSTVEGRADNARINFLIASTVYRSNGERVFKNVHELTAQRGNRLAAVIFSEFLKMNSGDFTAQDTPEVKFLKEFGFADEQGRLLNNEGKLVDIDGNLVDENGNLINEDGQLVDLNGRKIDSEGNYIDEPKGFTD